MKKIKLFSIQSVILVLLFVCVFVQWQMLSGMEKEKNETQTQYSEEVKEYQGKYETIKAKQEEIQKENEQLKNNISNILFERGTQKVAYLTFDDGPSKNTELILKTLKKYNVPATFFVNGSDTEFAIKMYKEMVKNGHTIGNHTYSHDYSYIYKNEKNFWNDAKKLDDLLLKETGQKTTFIRFPGGSNNTISIQYGGKKLMNNLAKGAKDKGYVFVDWNVDSQDASAVKVNKKKIVQSVLSSSKGMTHVNILMHDAGAKETTVKALPEIIEGLKKQGFEFRAMSEYSSHFEF